MSQDLDGDRALVASDQWPGKSLPVLSIPSDQSLIWGPQKNTHLFAPSIQAQIQAMHSCQH